ncbi:MAG: hypothetical protein AAB556_01290 [Patescibacteria group bacterium]
MKIQSQELVDHVKSNVLLAVNVFRSIFEFYELKLAEVVKYRCEEKPHFDEAKKLNPKAQRSVVKALQHTPGFYGTVYFHTKARRL